AAASVHHDSRHKAAMLDAALRCEKEGTTEAARNARDVARDAYAANAAAANAAYAANAAADAAADAANAANAANATAAADAAADAANAANLRSKKRDEHLSAFAEDVVQILVAMKVPGVQWLDLAPLAA